MSTFRRIGGWLSGVVAGAFVSLDGVMQAPGGPEEDRTGGFASGGWTAPHFDDVVGAAMAEARRLLLHSDERVEIIAERVGYADATHFIRMFRRGHGATPAAWRAAQGRRRLARVARG